MDKLLQMRKLGKFPKINFCEKGENREIFKNFSRVSFFE